jgi:ubiquinone/menaquinone biosynthesis C-methylase UbiE
MSRIVRDFYNANAEHEHRRLDLPLCRVEFASTLHLMDAYFPKGGRACDIGGATGRYTMELLRRGYVVTLLDLSAEEVQIAARELEQSGLSAQQLIVGDARDLGMLPARSFDAALLMGPMYHILEPEGRAQALRELHRVLKPRGVAIIAYLNAWGILKTGIADFSGLYDHGGRARTLLSEQTFHPQSPEDFTESYLSTPPVALGEVRAAGFDILSYAGAESFVGGMALQLTQLKAENRDAYESIVEFAAETCELEQYRDSTDHLHIVARSGELPPGA